MEVPAYNEGGGGWVVGSKDCHGLVKHTELAGTGTVWTLYTHKKPIPVQPGLAGTIYFHAHRRWYYTLN
jgi:hypothetical protein